MILELALLFQYNPQLPVQRSAESYFDEAERKHREIQAAKDKDTKHAEALLKQRHLDFIHAFNLYLDGYRKGMLNVKNLQEAVKAFKKLEQTEGFKEYANPKSK